MKHVLLLCLLALVCACSSDGVSDAKENDAVSVNLRIVTRSGNTLATSSEMELEDIRILVYDQFNRLEENYLLKNDEFEESEAGVYLAECKLEIRPGNKTFCLVANEESVLLADELNNVNKVETLNALNGVFLTTIPSKEDNDVLPFTCHKTCAVKWGKNEIDFSLKRAVARVDLRLWKAADVGAEVKLTSITVLDQATKSRLMEGNPLPKADVGLADAVKTFTDPIDIETKPTATADQDAATVLASFYLFEYTPATGEAPTSLEVSFTVGGVAKTATIPLAGAKDEAGDYIYCIRRNTLTDLRLTYENGGLKLNYTVTDWDDTTDPYDKELGEDDSNWWYADWIDVEEYDKELEGNSF